MALTKPLQNMQVLLLFAVLCNAWQVVVGMYAADGPVEVLTEERFTSEVLEGGNPWLLTFYHDNCKSCMQFAPEYSKVGNSLKGIVKVGAVDCSKTSRVCAGVGIKELPAIKLYSWETQKNPYTGKWYKDPPLSYAGDFSSKKVAEFATSQLPSHFVHNITAGSSAETFLTSEETLPKVVLFSAKEAITPLYKSLSLQFRGRLQFAQAKASDEALTQEFGTASFPALFVRVATGENVKYEGPLKADPIAAFLRTYAAEVPKQAEAETGKAEEKGGEEAGGESARDAWVKKLEGAQFEKKVLEDEEEWLVAFLGSPDSEECAKRQQEWKQASSELTGMVRMGELNVSTDEEAARLAQQYRVGAIAEDPRTCVAVLLFPFGEDKAEQEPELYTGPLSGKELSAFALEALPDAFVRHLSGAALKAFGDVNPQMPKVILFSSKTETSPMYKALSINFRKYIAFGQVHSSDTEAMEDFKVTKVPYVAFMVARAKRDAPGGFEMLVNRYPGPLKYPQLSAFCNEMASFALGMYGQPSMEADVPELTDDAAWEEHCKSKGRLCAIGMFDGPGKVSVLQSVAAIWTGGQFAFSWVDASKAPGWAAPLGVGPRSAPTLVVLSPGKGRFAVLAEDFSARSLQAFLEGLLAGRVRTSPLEVMPSFSSASDAGVEAEPPPEEEPIVEEEFSLEDVLGEELEGTEALGTKSQRLLEVEKELEAEQARQRAEEEAKASSKKKKKKKKKVVKKTSKEEL